MSKLAIAYGMKKKMAKGGSVYKTHAKEMRKYGDQSEKQEGVHVSRGIGGMNKEKFGESHAGYSAKEKMSPEHAEQAKAEHYKVLGEMEHMGKPNIKGLAEGGEADPYHDSLHDPEFHGEEEASGFVSHEGNHISHNEAAESEDDEMIARIMSKREQMYSKGGRVANDDHAFEYEFEEPANHDDLSRRDNLSFAYTGANSGDELGDERLDHDNNDIVSRVMKSRRKKDRLPNPA